MDDKDRRDMGSRSMSQGFIAQYAAEASLDVKGVASLDKSMVATLKESFGVNHLGQGVAVNFDPNRSEVVDINVYPNIIFGYNIPEIAWEIQSNVKKDVEKFTDLKVNSVNVFVMDVVTEEETENE